MTTAAETTTVATLVTHHGTNEDDWHGNTFVQFRRMWGDEYLTVIDGEDAFKNKAVCPRFTLTPVDKSIDCFLINSDWLDQELDFLLECLKSLEWETRPFGSYESITIDGIRIERDDLNAKRVFNPNALDRLGKVKSLPESGTVRLPTVIKLLVNEQVSCYHDQKLTDDYLFDSSTNFGAGEASNLYLAEKLIDSPSGWRAYMNDKGTITVACHHFDYYTLKILDNNLL